MTDITGLVERLTANMIVDPEWGHASEVNDTLRELDKALIAQSEALSEWKKLAAGAKGALFGAQGLMIDQGRWKNDAGYTTDVALWIKRAMDDLDALTKKMEEMGDNSEPPLFHHQV